MNLAADARHNAAHVGTPTVRLKPDTTYFDAGYAMAALLVAMSVMAVVMSVAMPTWSHMIRREKEEELIFRGNQYARAIGQYQRKYANASPPSLDILVEQKLLRKKYKDPLSPNKDGEFELLHVTSAQKAGLSGTAQQPGSSSLGGTKPTSGITGVVSKNKAESIRVLNGKNHYNEWQFMALQQSTQAGPTGQGPMEQGRQGGTFAPADRSGRGMQPFGRGQQQQQPPPPPGGRGR